MATTTQPRILSIAVPSKNPAADATEAKATIANTMWMRPVLVGCCPSMSVGNKEIRMRATPNATRKQMTLTGSGLMLPAEAMAIANDAAARATSAV